MTDVDGMAFEYCQKLRTVEFTSETLTLKSGVFSFCNKLQKVIFKKVTSVDKEAFTKCSSLVSLLILDSDREQDLPLYSYNGSIYRREDMSLFVVPNGITELFIYDKASQITSGILSICTNLKTIIFPNNCQDLILSLSELSNVTSLETIVFPVTYKKIQISSLSSLTNLRSISLGFVEGNSFKNLENLETVNFWETSTFETLPEGYFENCFSLKEINLPQSIKTLSKRCFYSCNSLENINLSNNLETIEEECFARCSKLKEIECRNCKNFGIYCFKNCEKMVKFSLNNSNFTVLEGMFMNNFKLIELESVVIKNVSKHGFANCFSLSDEYLMNVEELGDESLINCSNITVIPRQIKKIGASCFTNCNILKTIYLPKTILSIGENSFELSGVKYLNYCGKNDFSSSPNAFGNSQVIVYVTNAYNFQLFCGIKPITKQQCNYEIKTEDYVPFSFIGSGRLVRRMNF